MKLYDGFKLTEEGQEFWRKLEKAMEPLFNECVELDVPIAEITAIATHAVSGLSSTISLEKGLVTYKRQVAELRELQDTLDAGKENWEDQ